MTKISETKQFLKDRAFLVPVLARAGMEFCRPDEAENWIKVSSTPGEDGNYVGQLLGYIRLPHKMKYPEAYRAVRRKVCK